MSPRLKLGSTTASPLQPETPELLLLPRVMERTPEVMKDPGLSCGIAAIIPINTKMDKLLHLKFWKMKKVPYIKSIICDFVQLIEQPILPIPNFNFPNLRCYKVFLFFLCKELYWHFLMYFGLNLKLFSCQYLLTK